MRPNVFSLAGRTVLVTGASAGLGEAIALAVAEAGASVSVCARRTGRLETLAERLESGGTDTLAVTADVSAPEDCTRAVVETVRRFGRLDVLINNAGVAAAVPALREDPASFRRVLDVNLHGSYWMSQAAAAEMSPGSAIVNVSSVLGVRGMGLPQAAYSSSKAAVLGLTRDLARQWGGRRGIRVNAVVPGFFPSEMTEEIPPVAAERALAQIPLGRLGVPAELAHAVVFLASDAAAYVNGAALTVDGGYLA
jgi:NAD(P)-dependent dehydrogenase (short-subunit alcohol dehydrogenase family)